MNNLKLVESIITANDTNDLERFTKEDIEKFSKLNVMEQSPKIKFQKDGTALHFLPKISHYFGEANEHLSCKVRVF